MNFIAKRIHWIGLLLLVGFTATAAALYFDSPSKAQKRPAAVKAVAAYVCPMHPDVVSDKPGNCPKCDMNLVASTELSKAKPVHAGCGMTEALEADGCCGKASAEMLLPPGHPPIPGYTVKQGCNHNTTATNSPTDKL